MNIIESIKKEIEKGNNLITKDGNFISPLKVQATTQKVYISGAKNGSIDITKVTFSAYLKSELENYTKAETLLYELGRKISKTEETKETEEK